MSLKLYKILWTRGEGVSKKEKKISKITLLFFLILKPRERYQPSNTTNNTKDPKTPY